MTVQLGPWATLLALLVIIAVIVVSVYLLLSLSSIDVSALIKKAGTHAFGKFGPTYETGPITVRLSSNGLGIHYLRTEISLEVDSSASLKELREREPQVRDAIITYLSGKTEADLSAGKLKTVKQELVSRLNEILPRGSVRNTYFTDFVVQ